MIFLTISSDHSRCEIGQILVIDTNKSEYLPTLACVINFRLEVHDIHTIETPTIQNVITDIFVYNFLHFTKNDYCKKNFMYKLLQQVNKFFCSKAR